MLLLTVLIFTIVGALIGLGPTFLQVGNWAILWLVFSSLLLGFALGGEWGGAFLLMTENVKEERKGFWSAFPQSTPGIGLLLGSVTYFALASAISANQMYDFGWRIPFLLCVPIGLVGLVIRYRVSETTAFQAVLANKKNGEEGTRSVGRLKDYRRHLLLGTLLVGSSGNIFFVGITLFPIVFELLKVVSVQWAQVGIGVYAMTDIVFVFIGGRLSDFKLSKFGRTISGRKSLVIASNIVFLCVVYPAFYSHSILSYLIFVMLFGVAHGLGYASVGLLISENLPTGLRYTGNSMMFQIGNAFISAPASFISVYLSSIAYALYPAYPVVFSFVAFGAITQLEETTVK